jgi:hypothetical protein
VRHFRAGDEAMICLLDLVPVIRIVEVVGEIREQVEVVADPIRRDASRRVAVAAASLPVAGPAATVRVAPVGRVDRSKPIDGRGRDHPLCDLIGRVPQAVIAHAG